MKNRLLLAAIATVALAACGHKSDISVRSAVADATAPSGPVIAAAGSSFYGKLGDGLSTKTSKDGDTFTIAQADTLLHKGGPLAGAVVEGHLTGVVAAGPLRKPNMTLVFDDIRLADGTKEPVDVAVVSQRAFDPKTHHLRTIGMMLGGAFAAKHIVHGHGMLGAVAGYAASQALKTDIVVPAGATIELRFNKPVTSARAATAAP